MKYALSSTLSQLADILLERRWQCSVAESCTGGLIGASITSVSGASRWFAGGVISYSNDVKIHVLGVSNNDLSTYGAVSEQVVLAMACGVARLTKTQASVAVSGIAGPDGGTPEKPVGTVWIGVCVQGVASAHVYHFGGNRDEVRAQTVETALSMLVKAIQTSNKNAFEDKR